MQVASSFSHAVVLAPDGDVDALFLLGNDKKSLKESLKLAHIKSSKTRCWIWDSFTFTS